MPRLTNHGLTLLFRDRGLVEFRKGGADLGDVIGQRGGDDDGADAGVAPELRPGRRCGA